MPDHELMILGNLQRSDLQSEFTGRVHSMPIWYALEPIFGNNILCQCFSCYCGLQSCRTF